MGAYNWPKIVQNCHELAGTYVRYGFISVNAIILYLRSAPLLLFIINTVSHLSGDFLLVFFLFDFISFLNVGLAVLLHMKNKQTLHKQGIHSVPLVPLRILTGLLMIHHGSEGT